MKGLFYRELYLQRKGLIAVIITFFVFNLLGLLLYLSLLYGNLGKIYLTEMDTHEMKNMLFGIFTYFTAFIIMLMPMEAAMTISSDYAIDWMRFQRCLPYKPAQHTLVKMILLLGELLAALVFAILNALVNRQIFSVTTPTGDIIIPIVLLAALCYVMSLVMEITALLTRSKTGVASAMILVGLYIIIIVTMAFLPEDVCTELEIYVMTTVKNDIWAFLKKLLPWALGIMAVMLTGSFFAMTALFTRREK